MSHLQKTLLILGACLLLPAAAQADSLETPAPNAQNLVSAAGWHAWSGVDANGNAKLQLRKPDGTVFTPDIPSFVSPVDAAIGTRGGVAGDNTPAGRRLSAVYSRCKSAPSAPRSCDVWALDLTTLREAKVAALARPGVDETAPSVTFGNWTVVRRGGARQGTFAYSERGGLKRLTTRLATETATSTSRSAYVLSTSKGFTVQIRRSSGDPGTLVPAARLSTRPVSLALTRYRAGWLMPESDATHVFLTKRFAGSGGPFKLSVGEASRTLPKGVRSAGGDASTLFTHYADAAGILRIDPAIR